MPRTNAPQPITEQMTHRSARRWPPRAPLRSRRPARPGRRPPAQPLAAPTRSRTAAPARKNCHSWSQMQVCCTLERYPQLSKLFSIIHSLHGRQILSAKHCPVQAKVRHDAMAQPAKGCTCTARLSDEARGASSGARTGLMHHKCSDMHRKQSCCIAAAAADACTHCHVHHE
jgi:hypothetical protein